MIFISDIKEVVDNYGGKKGHFLLKLEKEEVHLKCDENKDKNSWVEAINLLIELYQGKKIFDWDDDRKSHQDKIDVRVLHQIMDEHEEHFRDEILKKQDYSKVLKAKKLKNSLDLISRKIYDNHVVMGFVKKTSGQQIDVDVASDDRKRNVSLLDIAGLKNILPRNLMIWKDEFFIMITSKAFTVFGKEVDDHVISECDVPHWFELDTLYMFKYENDQDESEYFKKFNAKNFLMVEPANDSSFKGKYHFILETKEKVYFVGNETCKETNRWVAALKKAKLTAEENSRAKGSAGLRNIDNLVSLYKKKVCDNFKTDG